MLHGNFKIDYQIWGIIVMFNIQDRRRNRYMLTGPFAYKGYDWWWHSFTGIDEETGRERQFFIEFFLCNPAFGGCEPVFGQLTENKENGIKPSYLMVKAGSWGPDGMQLHRFFGWDSVEVNKQGNYRVCADDCIADDDELHGSISITPEEAEQHPEWMCGNGSMSWDLTLDKKIAFNVGYGASKPFRDAKAFEMYWHAEGMKTLFAGTVVFNGRRYSVEPERSWGYADKNWGRNFTSPWVWLSSNHMRSLITGKMLKNSVFDIGGGRPKVYNLPLERKLLGAFYYEGREYEYNFSKVWTEPVTKFKCWETEDEVRWYVRQENRTSVMVTAVKCRKKDMLWVNYEAPDGKKLHNRLWNGGNGVGRIKLYSRTLLGYELIDDIAVSHIGCEYGEYDSDKI